MITTAARSTTSVPASDVNAVHARLDPNKPVADLLHILEDRRDEGLLSEDQIQTLDNEEPYVPLQLAEIRVTSLMSDLQVMKDDHVNRMKTLQKAYDDLLRKNHAIAKETLDKAREKAAERIKFYKDKAQEINKQLIAEKKNMEKQQRANEREMRALKQSVDAIIKAKKDLDDELEAKEKRLNEKHEEVRELTAKLTEYDEKYGDAPPEDVASKEDLIAAKAEVERLTAELAHKSSDAAQLEETLKTAEAELVKVKALVGTVAAPEMEGLLKELDEAKATIPVLEAEKTRLAAEIERLTAVVGGQDTADNAQVEMLKARLEDLDQARRAEVDRFKAVVEEMEGKAESEKEAALAAQRELYDKMIKQMIKAGKAKEEAEEKKKAGIATDSRLAEAQREAEEAARKKEAADKRRDELENKFKYFDDRLREIEAELAAKKARLDQVEPEYTGLSSEIKSLEAAAAEADGRKARSAQYTEEDGRAQMAKFGLPWNNVNGPIVAQLLDICKHYNLMKALQEDMRAVKQQHEEAKALAESPDLDVAGPAKVKVKELAAQFKALKGDATAHKSQWYNPVQELGLKNGGLGMDKDEDFEQLALAAEMWHEVMRKDPDARNDGVLRGKNGAVIPENLVRVLGEFGLDPAAVNDGIIAQLEGIVRDFGAQRAKQEELKDVKNAFEDKKVLVKEKDEECNQAKQALAEAKAEGKSDEEIAALQEKVEQLSGECTTLKKEAKALMEKFHALKPEAKTLQEQWKGTVAALGLESPAHTFEQVSDFELLTYVANEYKDWQEREGEEPVARVSGDDDGVNGPSDEMRARVKQLEEEKAGLGAAIVALEGEKDGLVKEKEEYEDMHQMAALATVAANKEAQRAKQLLKKIQDEVMAEGGDVNGDVAGSSGDAQEEEEDLTGGNAISINEDIAEAHKELMEAKFALAQAQKQAEVYKQQIHEERTRHQGELDALEARIRELEAEIELWKKKEIQWKVSAGTFYAKAGIGGVQSQSVVAHEFPEGGAAAAAGDEELQRMVEELKKRVADTQRELERTQERERAAIMKQREVEEKLKSGDVAAALAASEQGTDVSSASLVSSSTSTPAATATGDSAGAPAATVVVGNAEEEARLRAEADDLRTQLQAAKAATEEERTARKKVEADLAAVQAQLATVEASASGSSAELQAKLKTLSGSLSAAETALSDTKEKLSASEAAMAEQQAQHAKILADLTAARDTLEQEKKTLQGNIADLDAKLASTTQELEARNADLTAKLAELAALGDQIRDLRAQLVAKDEEMIAKLAAQEAASTQALEKAQAEALAVLEAKEAEAKALLDTATEEKARAVAALDGEIALKEAALSDARDKAQRIDELNNDVADWTQRHNALQLKYVEEQERRKYFQQEYEAAKGKIRVYARVRPFIRLEKESTNPQALMKCVHPGPNVWSLLLNMQKMSVQDNKLVDDWVPKTFDHIFLSGYEEEFGKGADNGSQAQVFKECEGFAEMAFDGLNTCIFAYGQSGSGKTWTMRGSTTDPEQYGLKPRMVRHMYEMQEKTKARYESKITCSMFEIYNDEIQDIFDRLDQVLKWEAENKKCYKCFDAGHSFNACVNCAKCRQSGHNFSLCKSKQVGKFYLDRFEPPAKKLEVKVLGNQRVSIPGLQQRECASFEAMQKLCDDAELLRRVRATGLNDESSRSHLIFAIYVEKKERNPKDKKNALPTYGKLSLCDLAGSEKVERTQMASDLSPNERKLMIEEGKRINASLSVLTSIFAALGAKLKPGEKRQLPRYRENLLTNVMQDSIGGNARTLMFVNVSPSLMNFEETKQTLSYGDLVQNITGTVATADVDVEQYLDKIAELEDRLKRYEAQYGGGI